MTFSKGDKVVRIAGNNDLYREMYENRVYTVKSYDNNNHLVVEEASGCWFESRFRLATAEEINPLKTETYEIF